MAEETEVGVGFRVGEGININICIVEMRVDV